MTPMDEFKARWNDIAMPIPFVEVVNTQVDTDELPELWASALLQSEARRDLTMGETPWFEEAGTIIVGMFARSGTGRSGLDAATTALREYFHGYISPDQTLHFRAVVGPEDIDPEADGEWWRLGFAVPYTIEDRRVEPLEAVDARAAFDDFHHLVQFEIGQ